MAVFSFISMYILMYAMVNTITNVFNNFNQFYMAGLMTAPMVIELFVMRSMYQDKTHNALIVTGSIIAALLFFLLIRQQTAI
jgi:hypothetical protein